MTWGVTDTAVARLKRIGRQIAMIWCLLWACAGAAWAERIALVVGNAEYTKAGRLLNPANDARDIAETLENIGFEVDLAINLDFNAFRQRLRSFQRRSQDAQIALVYFAGHGVEIDNKNYLLPVDAELDTADAIDFEGIPLDLLVSSASNARKLSLVVVDACRDNPFLNTMQTASTTRSVGRGLTLVEPPGNSLVAYAAKGGTLALDGDGRNSPYAEAFNQMLQVPQLEIGKFFRAVRDQVLAQTNSRQEPYLYGSLSADDIFLNESTREEAVAAVEATQPAPQPTDRRAGLDNASILELTLWSTIHDSQDPGDFEDYLEVYPEGRYSRFAERRLARLQPEANEQVAELGGDARQVPVDVPPGGESLSDDGSSAGGFALALVPYAGQSSNGSETVQPAEPEASDRLEGEALALAVQTALDGLGCNPGPLDGDWGSKSRSALQRYEKAANVDLASLEPNMELLTALRQQTGRICPLECAPRYVASGNSCVLKSCPSGQRLSSGGSCYTPQRSSKGKCTVYNGIRLCE